MATTAADVQMNRLRAEIAQLRERLTDSSRELEARNRSMLLAETPLAAHAYRLAWEGHERVRARLLELEADLGALILEREGLRSAGRQQPRC